MPTKAKTDTKRGLQSRTIYFPSSGNQTQQYVEQVAWRDEYSRVWNSGNYVTATGQTYHRNITTYLEGTRTTISGSGVNKNYTVQRGPTGLVGLAPPDETGNNDSICYNNAVASVYEQLRGAVDLSVSVAESGQVAGLFRNYQKYMRYVLSFRKGYLKEVYNDFVRNGPKNAGARWLEFQYGWKPLAQDLYGSLEQIGNVINQKDGSLLNVQGRGLRFEKWNQTIVNSGQTQKGQAEIAMRCEVKIHCRIKESTWTNIGKFTSLNPASIAWELTPYSFVVDWFYDVGGYLRSMESALASGVEPIGGYVTWGKRIIGTNSVYGETDQLINALKGSFKFVAGKRMSINNLPWPRPPVFKADLGAGRLLNAAALLSQHLR